MANHHSWITGSLIKNEWETLVFVAGGFPITNNGQSSAVVDQFLLADANKWKNNNIIHYIITVHYLK